jgi:hypothetical protein
MDSTKSFSLFAAGLAYVCLAQLFLLPVAASPVVASDDRDCPSGCALDITLVYTHEQELVELPSTLSDILSKVTGQNDLQLTQVPRHSGILRDLRFNHNHARSAPEGDGENQNQGEEIVEAHRHEGHIFSAFFKLSSASGCADLANVDLSDAELSAALQVDAVLSFFAVKSRCGQAAKAAPTAIKGTAGVVIADFEDGSSDKYAEVTTEAGEVFVVGGPDSDNVLDLSEWSAMRTGDEVEMEIDAELVAPHSQEEIVLATANAKSGMGEAYANARPRHPIRNFVSRTPAQARHVGVVWD